MKRVILESPYAGDVERNLIYARKCVHHSLKLGEAPLASHLLYTQEGVLDDTNETERDLGISAGLSWYRHAELCVVYEDRGISQGMLEGIRHARLYGIPVEFRKILL